MCDDFPCLSLLPYLQLDDSSNHKECSYPEYSSPVCTTQNPCDFTCTNGFTASPDLKPTECICVFPFSVCNGECGLFFSCHSNLAKRQDDMWKKTGCNRGWSPCGVFGGRRRAWECVNTQSDLESCQSFPYPLHSRIYQFLRWWLHVSVAIRASHWR